MNFFLLPHCMACRILVPWSETEFMPLAVKAWSPNHRTAREFPISECSWFSEVHVEIFRVQGYHVYDLFIYSSVQSLSRVRLFATPWIAARQASLSITNSWSSPKLLSIESVMPSSHLILCHPLLLLPPVPPSIRVFSNESTHWRWPKYWSFSFSISPSN